MNREEVLKLLMAAATNSIDGNFTAADLNDAAMQALSQYLGVDGNERSLRRLSGSDFEIIEEVIEELTPTAVEDIVGQFAEVKTFGRNDQVMFTIKNVGGNRVMQGIVPGQRAGIYKVRRLDNRNLDIVTRVETVGYALSLEDLITGRVTLADYVKYITQGFVEIVYRNIITALRAGAKTAPTANRAEIAGAAIDLKQLDEVIRVVAAYGTPTIFGFESLLGELGNVTNANLMSYSPGRSAEDLKDIRDYGRVMKYRGRTIVLLPNFLTDNTNTKWAFDESELFILPTNEKPVKVAFHGDLYVVENSIPSGGVEFFAHRSLGVAILAANAIGSVKVKEWAHSSGY